VDVAGRDGCERSLHHSNFIPEIGDHRNFCDYDSTICTYELLICTSDISGFRHKRRKLRNAPRYHLSNTDGVPVQNLMPCSLPADVGREVEPTRNLGERIVKGLQSKWPITLDIFTTHNSIGFRYRLSMGLFLVILQATITSQGFQEKFIKACSEIVIMMLLSASSHWTSSYEKKSHILEVPSRYSLASFTLGVRGTSGEWIVRCQFRRVMHGEYL
jgi:hypothetical protein